MYQAVINSYRIKKRESIKNKYFDNLSVPIPFIGIFVLAYFVVTLLVTYKKNPCMQILLIHYNV